MNSIRSDLAHVLLIVLVALLSLGALAGGLGLVLSPEGSSMSPPISVLETTPFSSFLIPGLLLFIILGIWPLITVYGLITKSTLFGRSSIKPYEDCHWSWTFAYGTGIVLILWIDVQLMLGVGFHILHFSYILLGLLILILVHLPGVKSRYRLC